MQHQTQQGQQYGTYQPYPGPAGGSGGQGQSYPPQMQHQPQQQQPQHPEKAPIGVGEMPADNAEEPQVPPSAPPPVQHMDSIQGYEQIMSGGVSNVPPPPSYAETMKETSGAPQQFGQSVQITEEEARQCLVEHAEAQCCWDKSAAEAMTINSVQPSTAVHYILRTYQETRATDWASEPYRGQMIDGPQNGMPPQPWDIQVTTPPWFTDQTMHIEVPHTASVKMCHGCHGSTMTLCYSCRGWGCKRCTFCSGTGHTGTHDNRHHCTWCHGSGRSRCHRCHGVGRVPCATCDAAGQVKYYIRLTVGFKTHTNDFILERTALPDHMIRDVTGTTLFEDTQPYLYPIRAFPEAEVNRQSESLMQRHAQLAQSGRIWMQSHVIRGVPVFQCDCTHKGKAAQFFVYGNDRKVHAPDYPDSCCWGCQLL